MAVEPVNMTMSTASTTASPVSAPPDATASTPLGSPHSSSPRATSNEVRGVSSDGLRITALPAASAGIVSPKPLMSG